MHTSQIARYRGSRLHSFLVHLELFSLSNHRYRKIDLRASAHKPPTKPLQVTNIADFWSKKPESVIKASVSGRQTCLTTLGVCLTPGGDLWMEGKESRWIFKKTFHFFKLLVKRRAECLLLALARIHLFDVKSAPKFVSIVLRHA